MKKLTDLTLEELWQLFPIFLTEHRTEWKDWFSEEKGNIENLLLKCNVKRISHIGSTAIKNIWAKPIIDILVEIDQSENMQSVSDVLESHGYICMKIESDDRRSFNKGYTPEGFAEKVFHLHLRREGNNPEKYTKILRDFFDCCENAKPTAAHILLSKCAKKFKHLLITENVDQLHQNSGIDPIVLAGCDKYSSDENIMEEVKKSDFIVTIGLNSDESGFLKFYKTQNPQGRIISVNLTPTNYLSNADFFVGGDIQKIAKKIFEL